MYNMRSQVFAKSLPMPMVMGAFKRLEYLTESTERKDMLWKIVNALQKGLREAGFNLGNTASPVTPVFLSGTVAEATNLAYDLRENHGIFTSLVAYPVVPKDVILIRLIPTAMHTLEDVDYTIKAFKTIKKKLDKGEYVATEMKDAHVD
jgi:glycine C-acetyltransferase